MTHIVLHNFFSYTPIPLRLSASYPLTVRVKITKIIFLANHPELISRKILYFLYILLELSCPNNITLNWLHAYCICVFNHSYLFFSQIFAMTAFVEFGTLWVRASEIGPCSLLSDRPTY